MNPALLVLNAAPYGNMGLMAPIPRPAIDRFNEKWELHWSGCWWWTGWLDADGYPGFRWDGGRSAHRFSYQHYHGPIPPGMTVDHLCDRPRCVNPVHLALATPAANALRGDGPLAQNARKTHCVRGHAFDEANTYEWRGQRKCRKCRAENSRQRAKA
jgi:hypothetical protein